MPMACCLLADVSFYYRLLLPIPSNLPFCHWLATEQAAKAAEKIVALKPYIAGAKLADLNSIWGFFDMPVPDGNINWARRYSSSLHLICVSIHGPLRFPLMLWDAPSPHCTKDVQNMYRNYINSLEYIY